MAPTKFEKNLKKDLFLLISKVMINKLEDLTRKKTKNGTGEMQRSWELIEVKPFVYEISNSAEHAQYVDAGTGIYATTGIDGGYKKVPGAKPITPKKGKALAFKIGGQQFFVKSVKGIKPRKIMAVLLSKKVENELQEGLNKIFDKYLLR